jgi:(1->4)-alpha-D-glucan 1-alpha-D-glucosylmutase
VAKVALRFQQLTGPVTAKAVEDTAFYRYHRLTSLNDVGSDPGIFGASIAQFHQQNLVRARSWPLSMIAGATHDSKRGEDTAARIAVLSELPDAWANLLREVRPMIQRIRARLGEAAAPKRGVEYLFLQTLVGVWPYGWDGREGRQQLARRVSEYLLKAEREAKQSTSWIGPNETYERGLSAFIDAMMADEAFLRLIRAFCERIEIPAAVNGLAQTLLRLCAPGVPDTYQGTEFWQQTLVDPDNRRPVDFDARRNGLRTIRERFGDRKALAQELLGRFHTGEIKLLVVHAALLARRERPELFRTGEYQALDAGAHCVVFTRTAGEQCLLCAVPRLSAVRMGAEGQWPLGEAWNSDEVAGVRPGTYVNQLTGARINIEDGAKLAELFADLPVALFLRDGP